MNTILNQFFASILIFPKTKVALLDCDLVVQLLCKYNQSFTFFSFAVYFSILISNDINFLLPIFVKPLVFSRIFNHPTMPKIF